MSRIKTTAKILSITLLGAIALQGCGDATLQRLSGELSSKAKGSTSKLENFYTYLTKVQSEMRAEEVRIQADAATPLDPANPGPLATVSDSQIKIRKQSARFLETYCVQISNLVNAKDTNELNAAASDINKDYSLIDGIKNSNLIAGFTAGATPIVTSLKIVGRRGFAIWSTKKIKSSILDSSKAFEEQAENLKRETNADAEETKTRAITLLNLEERAYSKLKANRAPDKDLKDYQSSIAAANERIQAVTASNPSDIYAEMLESHRQLVKVVSSESKAEKKP